MSTNSIDLQQLKQDIASHSQEANKQLRKFIAPTPLKHSGQLSDLTGAQTYLKLDSLQPSGAFKVRGALTKLLSLSKEELAKGIITASTGNHGAAVAYGLKQLGATGTVFVPTNADPNKVQRIQDLGADVRYTDGDPIKSELAARKHAEEHNLIYLAPYNDVDVIAGQGTMAVELLEQLESLDYVFVALGGGGLTSGISTYLKENSPHTKIIACSPSNSNVMYASVQAGELLDLPSEDTLSDATAGGVEAGSITFPLCQANIDDFVNVSEEEIAKNILYCLKEEKLVVEGAAAVAVAGYLHYAQANPDLIKGKTVALIICGGNIGTASLMNLLENQA